MLIFKNEEFGDREFPPVPVWTLKPGKLKDETTITLINGIGETVNVDRITVMENFVRGRYRVIENENKIAVIHAWEIL